MSRAGALRPGMACPWVIAHRGDRAHAPENSMAAFARALPAGADAIETDVRLSRDGIAVLCHDADLQRVAGRPERVAELTAAELAAVDLGDGGIPSLAAALARFPQLPFFLEMKGEDLDDVAPREALARTTAREAQAAMAAGAAPPLLLSFDPELLAIAQAAAPELAYGRNLERPAPASAGFLSCAVDRLTPAFVAAAHDRGQPVLSFTVNEESALAQALACKVDGIFSDDPAWLRQALDARGLRPSA